MAVVCLSVPSLSLSRELTLADLGVEARATPVFFPFLPLLFSFSSPLHFPLPSFPPLLKVW